MHVHEIHMHLGKETLCLPGSLHSSKDTFPRNYNTHMYVYMEMCTCQGS